MNVPGSIYSNINFTYSPYTFENEVEDSLELNNFMTSEKNDLCVSQVNEAIRAGSRKFIINLQDNNCFEYSQALALYPALKDEIKIEIRFNYEFASRFTPGHLQDHIQQLIQVLNYGRIECIRFPQGLAHCSRRIYEYLAGRHLVRRAIFPNK